jgi:hypothetical protein
MLFVCTTFSRRSWSNPPPKSWRHVKTGVATFSSSTQMTSCVVTTHVKLACRVRAVFSTPVNLRPSPLISKMIVSALSPS